MMEAIKDNRIKLLIYWKQGPGTGGRIFWLRQKTHNARVNRARKLIQRYAGRYNAAILYDCRPGETKGIEIERYNSAGNLVIEKPMPNAD